MSMLINPYAFGSGTPPPTSSDLIYDSRGESDGYASISNGIDLVAGKFVAAAAASSGTSVDVRVRIEKEGTPPGDLTIAIYDDASGEPGSSIGSVIVSETNVPAWSDLEVSVTLASAIVQSSTYYVVIESTSGSTGSRHRVASDTTATGETSLYSEDSGATWTTISDQAVWFLVGQAVDSPTAFWLFDETSGTVASDEQGSHAGTYEGTFDLTAAALANGSTSALGLSGSGRAEIPHNVALNIDGHHDFAVKVWVKLTDGTTDALQVIADKTGLSSANNQWAIRWDNRSSQGSPQRFTLVINGAAADVAGTAVRTALEAGAWVVAVKRGHMIQEVWINGVLEHQSNTAAGGTNSLDIGIGQRAATADFGLSGTVDKFKLLQYAPSRSEIEAEYATDTA